MDANCKVTYEKWFFAFEFVVHVIVVVWLNEPVSKKANKTQVH